MILDKAFAFMWTGSQVVPGFRVPFSKHAFAMILNKPFTFSSCRESNSETRNNENYTFRSIGGFSADTMLAAGVRFCRVSVIQVYFFSITFINLSPQNVKFPNLSIQSLSEFSLSR